MATIQIGPQDALYYEHTGPKDESGYTYVFFNALTGDTGMWEAKIGPRLRESGHGTLVYNFRGQSDSPFSPGTKLDSQLIVNDARRLLDAVKPVRPIFVGLSIGGLFAANTWIEGAEALGLVLINTLRRDGPRLKWINDALVRCVEVGGFDLLRDLFFPLLFNENWLTYNRENFLTSNNYTPIDKNSGHYNLLVHASEADWDLPYERLSLPTLVITGLQDRIFLDRNDLDTLFARLPEGQRIEFSKAGHLIPAERPETLTNALLSFTGDL